MGRGPKPQLGKSRSITLHKPNGSVGKDLRVSGCAICRKYIFSTQKYVWTTKIGYVHEEECLKRVT